MLYLNLPLSYYITLLIVITVVIAILGFYYIRKINDPYIRLILIWTVILFELNFINMIFTLKNYLKNSKKRGVKGPKGERGLRGFTGSNNLCNINQCRKSLGITKDTKEYFGGNVNDNSKKIDDDNLKIGKCIFPFIHNHVFQWECVKNDPNREAPENGWCATELNGDLTVKKYGYCKNSDTFSLKKNQNEEREERLAEYTDSNYGITQLKIISGVTSDIKCPKNYTKIPKDLNSGTDGKFVYLCKKIELSSEGIGSFKVIKGLSNCPSDNSLLLKGNLNDGIYNASNLNICVNKVNSNFITDIIIKDNSDELEGYTKASTNINEGVSTEPIFLFYSNDARPGIIIDSAFIWGKNKKLYFFKDDKYWKFDYNNNLEENFPVQINSRWGNLPEKIDAVFTNPYDNKTYFFNGSLFYEYDDENLKIKDGFPKFINDYWKGIPDSNLDAVFVDKNNNVYFIKDQFLYKWNNDKKIADKGETLNTIWINAPNNISSMFTLDNKVYLTQSNKIYIYDADSKELESDSPKNINTVFKGI